MHRSGTSAITRVVNLLGSDLSSGLIPPKPGNVTGFWESESIYHIHNELLKEFGLLWHDFLPLPPGWEKTGAAREARSRLLAYLGSEFAGSCLFTVKDPRICRLVPLWIDALEEFGAEPLFLFCHRSPMEVAASLYTRDQIPWESSLLLWMRSYLEGEEGTRGQRRLFIAYDDLIKDWQSVTNRVAEEFELVWPRPMEEAAPEIEAFLSDGHRHHADLDFELIDNLETRELLRSLHQALRDPASDPGEGLGELRKEASRLLDRKSEIFAPMLKHERISQFKLQTDKARSHRFNRRLQQKIKELKHRARRRKQVVKIVLTLVAVTAAALGFAGGYFTAKRAAAPAPGAFAQQPDKDVEPPTRH